MEEERLRRLETIRLTGAMVIDAIDQAAMASLIQRHRFDPIPIPIPKRRDTASPTKTTKARAKAKAGRAANLKRKRK